MSEELYTYLNTVISDSVSTGGEGGDEISFLTAIPWSLIYCSSDIHNGDDTP